MKSSHCVFRVAFLCLSLPLCATQATAFCFAEASVKYGVSQRLLRAIARVESGMNPAATGANKNGTTDYGLMQINSKTLKDLGVSPEEAMEPCINVLLGARVLSENIRIVGRNWKAVGSYNVGPNSSRDDLRSDYVRKIHAALHSKEEGKNAISTHAPHDTQQASAVPTSNMLILE